MDVDDGEMSAAAGVEGVTMMIMAVEGDVVDDGCGASR